MSRWPEYGGGWHWLQYTRAPVSVPPEVWQLTANGHWCRSTQPKARRALDLQEEGWVYVCKVEPPA